ncbi:MAG: right-handed parallel beta-helix repeat-containing protein [Eubacteriales bacterium]|nr:right-handed parallel beta-helix repeat-containing protein [Eubacteriales bacterium]
MRKFYLFLSVFLCFALMSAFIPSVEGLSVGLEVWVSPVYSQKTAGWGMTRFSEIKDAVDVVLPGGTVYVGPGTYYENIIIAKSITLQGENPDSIPVINGGGNGDVITLLSDGITLKNLEITKGSFGINVVSDNNTITDCRLTENYFRIMIRGANNNTITSCHFSGKGEGIALSSGASNNIITDNTILGNYPDHRGCTAIRLGNSSYNLIADNTMDYYRVHVLLAGSDHNIVANNTISRSWPSPLVTDYSGISIYASDYNTIINNNISSIAQSGIRMMNHSTYNTIQSNKIKDIDHAGIDLYYNTNENRIENNEINQTTYGIILDKAYGNRIDSNSFINTNKSFDNGSNIWNYMGKGNYWSDYKGVDSNNDGLGDTSVLILPSGKQTYPLIDAPIIVAAQKPDLESAPVKPIEGELLVITSTETWENKTIEQRSPIMIMEGGTLTISNSNLQLFSGISVWNGGKLILENSELLVSTIEGNFIEVFPDAELVVRNSVITGKGHSIWVRKDTRLLVENNEFHQLGSWTAALHVETDGAVIKNNIIEGSYLAIQLNQSKDHQIIGNTILDGVIGVNSYGGLSNSNHCIKDNDISNMIVAGYHGAGVTNSIITGNTFRNIWGSPVSLSHYSPDRHTEGNVLYYNNFINSGSALDNGNGNLWYFGNSGNYWDDYLEKNPDAKEDALYAGTWDKDYSITLVEGLSNSDKYPLMVEDKPSDWALVEIDRAKTANITTTKVLGGYHTNITREEFCELAVKLYEALSGKKAQPVFPNPFNDTDNPEILKANRLGIVLGVSTDRFAPESSITRQELAVMLFRTLKITIPELGSPAAGAERFSDKDEIASWSIDAILFLNDHDIMKGVGEDRINPKGNTTKEQAIALAIRTYGTFVNQ